MEGVIVPVDEDFDVAGWPAAYPRDDRLPPDLAINCRCWLQAVTLDGAPIDESVLPADTPADVEAAIEEGDAHAFAARAGQLDEPSGEATSVQAAAGRRRPWRAWFEPGGALHTHGHCPRCGGWLQADKWCPACGGAYEGPGDSRDRSGPYRPDAGSGPETEEAEEAEVALDGGR